MSEPLRRSLEEALAECPDDLASLAAYADYMAEQGDPRGELIQVQLALEDRARSADERGRLRQREEALLEQHVRRCLGDVGRFLVGDWSAADKPVHYEVRRGWLDLVRLLPFPDAVIAALARAPEVRLLRRLEIGYDMRYHFHDFDQFVNGPRKALTKRDGGDNVGNWYMSEAATIMEPLLASPYLGNLRAFQLGFTAAEGEFSYSTMVDPFGHCDAHQVIELLGKCPRLEELYLNCDLAGIDDLFAHPALGGVRVLQYYYGNDYGGDRPHPYPLTALANNPALGGLTTLRLHPGRDATVELADLDAVFRSPHLTALTHLQAHVTTFGDEGARALVRTGVLRRLSTLDLRYGNMTDDGARVLAACPDLRYLNVLDLSRNALTAAGIAALRETGVRLVADDQHGPDDEDYLFEGDFE